MKGSETMVRNSLEMRIQKLVVHSSVMSGFNTGIEGKSGASQLQVVIRDFFVSLFMQRFSICMSRVCLIMPTASCWLRFSTMLGR